MVVFQRNLYNFLSKGCDRDIGTLQLPFFSVSTTILKNVCEIRWNVRFRLFWPQKKVIGMWHRIMLGFMLRVYFFLSFEHYDTMWTHNSRLYCYCWPLFIWKITALYTLETMAEHCLRRHQTPRTAPINHIATTHSCANHICLQFSVFFFWFFLSDPPFHRLCGSFVYENFRNKFQRKIRKKW